MTVTEIKKICQELGCSGVDPDMCQKKPELCNIIYMITHQEEICRQNFRKLFDDHFWELVD